jgi:hypothetical protein
MLFAVPEIIKMALSILSVKSAILIVAISFTCSMVTEPTFSVELRPF